MDERKSVGVWIRVSTMDQARGDSPELHRTRALDYAKLRGWEVVETYDLSGVSGKAVLEHSATRRMLDDVRSGRISGLVFSKLARLARNARDLLEISEIFQRHNADLVATQESIDTSTPAGRLFFGMIANVAQFEREEIIDRIEASNETRAKLGKRITGQSSFGFQWVDNKLVPHPDEAPVRKLIYELFAQHQRKKAVARILNERGYRTRSGAKFAVSGIQRLLTNPDAKGLQRVRYSLLDPKTKSKILRPEDEWFWHECPPIVSVELWDQCNEILERQAKGYKPGPRGKYLFAGKVRCACGEKMYVLSKNRPKYYCRACRNKLPLQDLEAIFRSQLHDFFMSDEQLGDFRASTSETIAAKMEQIDVLKRERQTLSTRRDEAWRGYNDGVIERERFKELEQEASARVTAIDCAIPELIDEIEHLKRANQMSGEIVEGARTLYAQWDTLTHEQKNAIIQAITDEILVGDRDIAINLLYQPSAEDSMQKVPHNVRWGIQAARLTGASSSVIGAIMSQR